LYRARLQGAAATTLLRGGWRPVPTYAFRCQSCGHQFEVETSWSQKAETRCPECDSGDLKEHFGMYLLNIVPAAGDSGADACGCGNPDGCCRL